MEKDFFVKSVINWYENNKRILPWRDTNDPYLIWLSEIILQQTRVIQGLPYYIKFAEAYPDIYSLASADERNILRLWQGLGYYSRARNLHACAKIIVEKHDGKFPSSSKELLKLIGIGKYTAAAVSSFAFKECVPVVDGNVYRVLSRFFGIFEDIASTNGAKFFHELASQLVPKMQPDLYNQAIMEFGALQCVPVSPQCDICILNEACFAYKNKQQSILPVNNKKVKIRERYFHYIALESEGKLFLRERNSKDIWKGLYDFYLYEGNQFKEFLEILNVIKNLVPTYQIILRDESFIYKHVLTHQRIYAKFFHLEVASCLSELAIEKHKLIAYTIEEIKALPKPILIDNYLTEKFF